LLFIFISFFIFVSCKQEMYLDKGFDDFLAKPIDVIKLDEILDRWIPDNKKESKNKLLAGE